MAQAFPHGREIQSRPRGAVFFILSRANGGGGPSEARAASEGWWKGRGPRRNSFDDSKAARATPPPPPCYAGWSPSPAIAGADKKRSRSRGAVFLFASEVCCTARKNGLPNKQGRRSAGKRIRSWSAPHSQMLPPDSACGRGRAPRTIALAETARRGRARLSALRHGSCPGSRTPRTRSRPRFTRKGGRGRYPRRSSRLSQAPGAPV